MANLGTQLDEDELAAVAALVKNRLLTRSAQDLAAKYKVSGEAVRKAKLGSVGKDVLQKILAAEGLTKIRLLEEWGSGSPKPKNGGGAPDRLERLATWLERSSSTLVIRPETERGILSATRLPVELKRAALAAAQLYDCSFEQATIAASMAFEDLGPKQDWVAEHWLAPIKERIPKDKASGTRPSVRLKINK